MRKISISIPTYNRTDLLYKAFEQVKDMPEVDEIVIVDDHSKPNVVDALKERFKYETKVRLVLKHRNDGVHLNKKSAIGESGNEWCILFDSDNVLNPDYIERLLKLKSWVPDVIYAPAFAAPHFDFRHFSGRTIDRKNVANAMGIKLFDTLINAQNCFVNRSEYLKVWQDFPKELKSKKGINGADSIYTFKLWMEAGNRFYVVPNLQYFHLVHNESFYKSVGKDAEVFCRKFSQELKRMK